MSDRPLDTDALFEVLADERRRWLLVDLLDRTGRPEVELPPVRSVAAEEPGRARIELHHVHLPKLESAGLVRWDQETGVVTAGPQFERTRPLLRLLTEHAGKLPSGWG